MTSRAAMNPGDRLAEVAGFAGDAPAVTVVHLDGTASSLTFGELHAWSDALAAELQGAGVDRSSTVAVALPNCLEHVVGTWAAWKVGAMVLPLSPRLSEREQHEVLDIARPAALMSTWTVPGALSPEQVRSCRESGAVPVGGYVEPHPGKCVASGGSTGRPKLIVDPAPLVRVPDSALGRLGEAVGFAGARSQLVPGPLYHNMPFTWSITGVFEGQHVVYLERFDAQLVLDSVARFRIEFMTLVPAMMQRIRAACPEPTPDLSSLRGVLHSAAPCPPALKQWWIDLVGPTVLHEAFGATEAVGMTLIRGDEWLRRPGSVGQGFETEIRILDADGQALPPESIGEIYMRRPVTGTYRYVGGEPATSTRDGFVSVGDLGYLDDDGYLFHADRRVDLIVTGGSNVYPAEVEAALLEHEDVGDAVVVGVADEEWGRRVHAIVELRDPARAPSVAELDGHCRRLLAPYKVPKSFEVVDRVPRDEAGKIRRRALVEARS